MKTDKSAMFYFNNYRVQIDKYVVEARLILIFNLYKYIQVNYIKYNYSCISQKSTDLSLLSFFSHELLLKRSQHIWDSKRL